MISETIFGQLPDGRDVTEFTLTNTNGIELHVLNYGCTITSLITPDHSGTPGDIVLGFDHLEDYLQSPHYFGCIIGRCANRIADGRFTLDGKTFQVTPNFTPHHLHGGKNGFDKKLWKATPFENEHGLGINFYYRSVDGEEGYPGNLDVYVRYFLSNTDVIILNYLAESDQPTLINLTQHTYFNLTGRLSSILNHGLFIHADSFLPIQSDGLPTGKIETVDGTPFDLRTPKLLIDVLEMNHDQIQLAHGLDHCWALHYTPSELNPAATLYDPVSKRLLELHTSEPGLQVYTGNALEGTGKNNIRYGSFSGIALETQHFPDSPNHPDFPNVVLRPGQQYQSTTIYKFSVLP